ncbi:uncharacterized protein CEXT_204361 [Caerostris extrusa]|uniref:Uncharacterized protein n=1 Tax=Caerostris extrusa TaxID=172846 RepID=A0AAV4SHK9_CAEEX|nr:uncharacterized protein CEXT_204361 [Caerostris extrusa]
MKKLSEGGISSEGVKFNDKKWNSKESFIYVVKNAIKSSESDIALDLSGNYKHYDNVGNDLKLVTGAENKETNNHVISSPSPTIKPNGAPLQLDTVDENDQEAFYVSSQSLP